MKGLFIWRCLGSVIADNCLSSSGQSFWM